VKPPPWPSYMKEYWAKKAIETAPLNKKIWWDLMPEVSMLESKLNNITAPTLIVWGDSDRIMHISSVPIFEKNIKKSQSVIIKDCGHLPMLEKPEETASIYKDFLKGNE
jgi:abhydrolase domain-containing protein 6